MGTLRVSTAASVPSASSHFALACTPTSLSSVASATPVHSLVLVSPASCPGVVSGPAVRPRLPEHSRKWMRDTDGKRFRSASVNTIGRSTMPWMTSA